jgi:ribonuclease P protein component
LNEVPIKGEKSSFRFRRQEHLKGRDEIREVFKGRRFGCRGAKLFMLKNNLPHNRICFTFSRGFGTAVERNRARRLAREAYRLMQPKLSGGNDLILLMYPETPPDNVRKMALSGRMEQLESLFTKAGLLK